MESIEAVRALSALAQPSRLAAFRLLVRNGPAGMPAGALAKALDVPPNTLSAQLAVLAHAGLVRSRRDGRSVIYAVDTAAMAALLLYLAADCCEGRPAICAPLARLFPVSPCREDGP